MHRLLLYIMLLSLALGAYAQPAAELMQKADSAYANDNYAVAADLYNQALQQGRSAEIHYNLGNAYYRLGKPGLAILNYERALRLKPNMSEARQNLAFVNQRITDRPGERGTFVGNALDAAARRATSNAWAWSALGTFILLIAGIALYCFSTAIPVRKAGFFGAGAMLVCTFVFVFLSLRGAGLSRSRAEAVIIKPSTILSTAPRLPRDRSQEAMLLHEGTLVSIRDSVRSATDSIMWLDVEVDNGHRAWLNAADAVRVVP